MKLNIAPKLFLGFLGIIVLNVSFVVIVSKLTDLNVIAGILKRQNEVKNDLLRISNAHVYQQNRKVIYDGLRKQESADNFRETGRAVGGIIDTVLAELCLVQRLDSLVSARDSTDYSLVRLVSHFTKEVKQNNAAYNKAFEDLVEYNTSLRHRRDPKQRKMIDEVLDASDRGLRRGLAVTDSLVEIQTQSLIRDIDSRVSGMRRLTLIIVVGISVFSLLFGFTFSRAMTNSLRRLREATSTIGRGEFDFNPRGYPKDEIGELATAFFEMAYDLKRTQEELVRSKRLAAIGQIVASVNHEINNPLMIISGNAQFLEMSMEGYPQEMKDRVRAILEETERISQVTRKLREIKNPVVEDYTSSGEQMINLDKSSD